MIGVNDACVENSEINNNSIVVFKTSDYCRSLKFINESIGYDILEKYPLSLKETLGFKSISIQASASDIGKYILDNI